MKDTFLFSIAHESIDAFNSRVRSLGLIPPEGGELQKHKHFILTFKIKGTDTDPILFFEKQDCSAAIHSMAKGVNSHLGRRDLHFIMMETIPDKPSIAIESEGVSLRICRYYSEENEQEEISIEVMPMYIG